MKPRRVRNKMGRLLHRVLRNRQQQVKDNKKAKAGQPQPPTPLPLVQQVY